MLYEFIAANRGDIISRTRERVRSRPWPSVSNREIEYGVPLFLTQLVETLQLERTATPFASLAALSAIMRLTPPEEVIGAARGAGLSFSGMRRIELPTGKRFQLLQFASASQETPL